MRFNRALGPCGVSQHSKYFTQNAPVWASISQGHTKLPVLGLKLDNSRNKKMFLIDRRQVSPDNLWEWRWDKLGSRLTETGVLTSKLKFIQPAHLSLWLFRPNLLRINVTLFSNNVDSQEETHKATFYLLSVNKKNTQKSVKKKQ